MRWRREKDAGAYYHMYVRASPAPIGDRLTSSRFFFSSLASLALPCAYTSSSPPDIIDLLQLPFVFLWPLMHLRFSWASISRRKSQE